VPEELKFEVDTDVKKHRRELQVRIKNE